MNYLWDSLFSNNAGMQQKNTQTWYSNITVVIKTFLRYKCLKAVVDHWLINYPNISLIIVDDTPINMAERELYRNIHNIKYIYSHELLGLSKGRNVGLSHLDTDLVFISDDDNLPPKSDSLKEMHNILTNSYFDIIGPGAFKTDIDKDRVLSCYSTPFEYGDIQTCDAVYNHFLAKSVSLPKWDENIFIAHEHVDFFLECKQLKIKTAGFSKLNVISVKHKYDQSNLYNRYRYDIQKPLSYLLNKWGLKHFKAWGIK